MINPSRPDPGRRGTINIKVLFSHFVVWCLKTFYEGLEERQLKCRNKCKEKCKNKNLS